MLRNRRMRREESVHEYFSIMEEIAAQGRIEAEVLMRYIVNGIADDPSREAELYEAEQLNELKEKLKIYERVRNLCRPLVKKVNAEILNQCVACHRLCPETRGRSSDVSTATQRSTCLTGVQIREGIQDRVRSVDQLSIGNSFALSNRGH